jgi:hypothetical protein
MHSPTTAVQVEFRDRRREKQRHAAYGEFSRYRALPSYLSNSVAIDRLRKPQIKVFACIQELLPTVAVGAASAAMPPPLFW